MQLTKYEQRELERIERTVKTVKIYEDTGHIFATVPSTSGRQSEPYTVCIDSKTLYSTSCTCIANSEHLSDCIHLVCTDIVLEARRAQAKEQAMWKAGEAQELAGIDQYLAERSAEEVKEQSQIESLIRQGIDRPTAERITYARPAPKGKPAPKGNSPKAFSLLK